MNSIIATLNMNLFAKFIERNNVFEKLKQGSDESIINVCNSIITFISNGSLRGSQPTVSVDEILMIFLEYVTLSTSSRGITSVLLCIEYISKINKKHEDCVLQTGLVGAIVDLLQNIQNNKFKKNKSNENGLIIIRMLSYFTDNDKRSCLIFRLHHGIQSLLTFIQSIANKNCNNYNQLIEFAINICHNCVFHSEHSSMQMFESNGLQICLQYISNTITKPNIITYCINLICSICKLNPKITDTFIELQGFKIMVKFLCQLTIPMTDETKTNVIKLLKLISSMCMNNICAKTIVSNGTLTLLYPFLFAQSQNEEIKCIASKLLTNILRYGMKHIINAQCTELYKFNETHTKIVINKNTTQIDETERIQFPELEPIKKRKEERQQPLNESECRPKSIIPFVIQPPLHEWSQILPKDFEKMKQNLNKRITKRKKRNCLTFSKSPTFNKSKTVKERRRKSASFILQNRSLTNTRSTTSLIIQNTAKFSNNNKDKIVAKCKKLTKTFPLNNNNNKIKKRISTHLHCNLNDSDDILLPNEDANKYVTLNWIKNYYTKTTQSYLDTRCLRGEPLAFQASNLIIKLLYQEIITKSQSDIKFIPKIVYDRNQLLKTNNKNMPKLEFESRFECGNLHRVIQTGPIEYDLLVSSDYNSTRHRQWFYFQIKNMMKNIQYKFNIVNYDKNDSVYNRGCKPTIYSTKRFKETGVKWTRANTNETYYYSNAFTNEYEPKFTEINESLMNKNENNKTISITEKKETILESSASPSPSSSSAHSSPIKKKKLNYKQIRKKRARLRNKEKQKFKEKDNNNNNNNNNNNTHFTNVLRRDNGMSFIIPTVNNYMNIMNNKKEYENNNKKYHYTLSFTISFPYSNDICYLSYFYPFSYSDLQGLLNIYCLLPINNIFNIFRRQLLCYSRLGNRIDLLTITNFNSTMATIRDRPIIILSSRVHPGEINSSFINKGIIDFLLSKNLIASQLRNKFVFKIIPCLNPDGVIIGNHRCSLTGVDLNRQYQNPSYIYHPSIFYLKKFVETIITNNRKIFLICDIHGHSRMMNITLYGCAPDADYYYNGKNCNRRKKLKLKNKQLKFASMDYFLPNYVTQINLNERYKLFAHLLSQRAPNMFNYEQCIWNISKQKEGTSRVVFWREFNIQNAFTMESTFCGSNLNYNQKGFHFNQANYLQIGAKFAAALYDMCAKENQSNESKIKMQTAIKELKSMQNQNIVDEYSSSSNNNNKKGKVRKRKKYI